MNHAKILDCTLRDGAYLVNKKFGEYTINGIVEGLVNAHVDFIEIGFFQDDEFGEGKTVYLNSKEAKKYVPADKGGCEFAVLADYSRYSVENLDECTGDSIDAVRECFFKHERFDAIEACKVIKQKGYKLFVQPVDILGYTDAELLDFIARINEVEPYCLSIVDTFGSMYIDDLRRVFELVNHNLIETCKVGFHSHNNMQMSSALSQEFLQMTRNKREVVIDGTISGMGRGAGNTPTELIAQYMVTKMGYTYDIDAILDIIDRYMDNIRSKCTWGYNTQYFIAGAYSAHVNNIAYLTEKSGIRSKEIRYILNKIGADARKRYEYDLLEETYLEYLESEIDDTETLEVLQEEFAGKDVLMLVPGHSVVSEKDAIKRYIEEKNPIIVSVNFMHDVIDADYLYLSNIKRYDYWKKDSRFNKQKKIIASNIANKLDDENAHVVAFTKLVKCGWDCMDNSAIMLLRLLDKLAVKSIAIAGFDGYVYRYSEEAMNYASAEMEISSARLDPIKINEEISSMLADYRDTRVSDAKIMFITESRFDNGEWN